MANYVSKSFRPDLIIDSGNEGVRAPRSANGRGREPRNWAANPYGSFAHAPAFERTSIEVIPRKEWPALIELQESRQSSLFHIHRRHKVPIKNQQNTNYCWINAPVGAIQLRFAFMGMKPVSLSPASCGARITGYRNRGGYGAEALKGLAEMGACESPLWPDNHWSSKKYLTTEAKENALLYRFTDWVECQPGNFDQMASCLLRGIPCFIGLNWWGHEVLAIALIAIPGGFGILFANSWGESYGDLGIGQMTERKARDGDCIGAVTTTLGKGIELARNPSTLSVSL